MTAHQAPALEGGLADLLRAALPPFALLYRPQTGGPGLVDLLIGDVQRLDRLDDLPRPPHGAAARPAAPVIDSLALIPYRQITERGFACQDDGEPVLALVPHTHHQLPLEEVIACLPEDAPEPSTPRFEPDDATYAATVRRVLEDEIGQGEGANFVIRRSLVAELGTPSLRPVTAAFRRLLERERGTYWTFLVHTGDRTFIGATPERHMSQRGGTVTMNPISGTYRYPAAGPDLPGVLSFLDDAKERDELYMVVDEELKMMGQVCPEGGTVHGPFLKEMSGLAHTEYVIEGRSEAAPADILRAGLFAPTVTGSPLASACRVIARHEPRGRGYYSGVIALLGRDADGPTLDSAILIRTADIDAAGRLEIGAGATLVRHSDPAAEAAETRAKTQALWRAFAPSASRTATVAAADATAHAAAGPSASAQTSPALRPRCFAAHPQVREALERRNARLAPYWFARPEERHAVTAAVAGRSVLVVDAEDSFTAMLAQQIRSLGATVTVRDHDAYADASAYDLTVLGPGPGDPRDIHHPKIAALRALTLRQLAHGRPTFAVCLSHQVLSTLLGLPVVRKDSPHQGQQESIDYFGRRQPVGFYNTFAAVHDSDLLTHPLAAGPVEVCRAPETGEVHALRGPAFASVQFHPESLLTPGGLGIVSDALARLLAPAPITTAPALALG
ncbi:anthranilate synthase family protein [Streptomyces puniciscabiei]|uniref:anthranilate synthase family protein n=1 Tax=Streptomyces puniciscabiei TaxID=164348 RepID=UPI0033194D83